MKREFYAPVLSATYDACKDYLGPVNVHLEPVPYDYAADLSNNIWGGPVVHVQESGKSWSRDGYLRFHHWHVTVIGFIVEEAWDVMHEVEYLLRRDGPAKYKNYFCQSWRFRDGELVRNEIEELENGAT